MKRLYDWLEAQFALTQVEPNSGLGKAITYLLRHRKGLTTFLRQAGGHWITMSANALETCGAASQECSLLSHPARRRCRRSVHEPDPHLRTGGANPFDYLTELQRHARELAGNPSAWIPWNYRETLARFTTSAAA